MPLVDRLTTLDDAMLIQILTLLRTKDVAATCFSSKIMSHVFPWITSLDFNVSPIQS